MQNRVLLFLTFLIESADYVSRTLRYIYEALKCVCFDIFTYAFEITLSMKINLEFYK